MIADIGAGLDASARAAELIDEVRFLLVKPPTRPAQRVFVAVWKEPLMGLGAATYGDDLLRVCGADNVLASRTRYPGVSHAELQALRPELIVLPDEPYPFKVEDIAVFADVAPARVIDGKLLWWYGPRMPQAIRELRAIFAEGRS
jgi:ABC-type hemin transport system substrate-binding protein